MRASLQLADELASLAKDPEVLNMRKYNKFIVVGSTLAALAVPAISPMMASASAPANQTYSVGTHSAGHADTTSNGGPGTIDSSNGPVWAYDNLNLKYVVAPLGTDASGVPTWNVAVTAQGSFAGFADPNNGQPQNNSGSVNGTITYTVTSPTHPNTALVPSQEKSGTGMSLPITQMFPKGSITGYGPYSFSYNKIDGVVYQQIG
jgi:hypothetical protein